jgi:hypothetical protein
MDDRFTRVPQELTQAVSPRAQCTYSGLLYFRNRVTGLCNPSYETVADYLRCSTRTVKRGVSELRAAGWIGSRAGHGAARSSNSYLFPFEERAKKHAARGRSEASSESRMAPPKGTDLSPEPEKGSKAKSRAKSKTTAPPPARNRPATAAGEDEDRELALSELVSTLRSADEQTELTLRRLIDARGERFVAPILGDDLRRTQGAVARKALEEELANPAAYAYSILLNIRLGYSPSAANGGGLAPRPKPPPETGMAPSKVTAHPPFSTPCPECEIGGGHHVDGCHLADEEQLGGGGS